MSAEIPKKTAGRKPYPAELKRVRLVCFVKPSTNAYFEKLSSVVNPPGKVAAEVLDCMAEDAKTDRGEATAYDPAFTRVIFYAMADKWKRETGHFSLFSQKANHPLYQGIISMKELALPILIEELDSAPRNWFLALRKIAKCNPVRHNATVEEAVVDWKAWWNLKYT